MPKLKVESALERYLAGELTDEEFKECIQSILNEFEGKNLLHQNIGQLTWMMEKKIIIGRIIMRGFGSYLIKSVQELRKIFAIEWKMVQVVVYMLNGQ
jgi:hypothetical protein